MKLADIMKLTAGQLARLDEAELKEVARVLASVGNKRLAQLERAGYSMAPAPKYIAESGGKFSSKTTFTIHDKSGRERVVKVTKSKNDLIEEIGRARGFLKAKTSTVKGAVEAEQKQLQGFQSWAVNNGIPEFGKWSIDEQKEFWEWFEGRSVAHSLEAYFANYKGAEAIRAAAKLFDRYKDGKDPVKARQAFRQAFRKAAERDYIIQTEEQEAEDERIRAELFNLI